MKSSQTNTFTGGMQKDLHPMVTPSNVLTDALNATIITMNGNESVLQNDMGNARIESAYLPSGYVPIGMKEHGGVIYIAAYNPLTKKGQIGSFPSPERNINKTEKSGYNIDLFSIFSEKNGTELKSFSKKFSIFGDDVILHPGDRFSLYADLSSVTQYLSNYNTWTDNASEETLNKKNLISLDFVVSDVNNNLRVITDSLKRFDSNNNEISFKENATQLEKLNSGYFIQNINTDKSIIDIERSLQAINTFNSRVAGHCYLLETINTVNSIEVSVEGYKKGTTTPPQGITFGDTNNVALKFTITYKYNCPEEYIAGCKIDFDEKTYFAPLKEYDKHDSYSNGEYQLTKEYVLYLNSSNNEDITYTVTPCMTFSELSGAAIKSKINLSKLNSGNISLTTWKYLVYNDRTQLVYGIEAYPYIGQTINNLRIEFTDLLSSSNSVHTIHIPSKRNYSGIFQEILTIPNNTIYAVRLLYNINDTITDRVITYGDNLEYKYLINTPIHNQYFYTTNDFQELILSDSTSYNNKFPVPISQNITPEEQLKEPQVYSEQLPPLTQNTQPTEVSPCKQTTSQRFVYKLTYTPYIVNPENYPFEVTDAITVKEENTQKSKVTATTLAYTKEKEINIAPTVTDSAPNIKTINMTTTYTSKLYGSYTQKTIDITGLFSPVNATNLFNFKDNTIFWLTFYNFVEGHSKLLSKPRPTMTGKVCLTTSSTDTNNPIDEKDAYLDAYVWETDVKHGGDHYRDLLRSDYNIKENVENYVKNNLGSPNVILFSGALKTASDYNRMSYSSALCKESVKDKNKRYYNYEFLWWKGTDDNYYLLKDFIVDANTNTRLSTAKSSVQFVSILNTLFSNMYVLGDSTAKISKELYVLTFGDQDYEKSFNADITIKIVSALQYNVASSAFKKDSIPNVNNTLSTKVSQLTYLNQDSSKLPIIQFTPKLEAENESEFVIKTTVKGMEDIYSKVQSIYDTGSTSNVALVDDNIISTDSLGAALSANTIYRLENGKLTKDQTLNNLFVVINNQIRIKPELTQSRKEQYCLYDSTRDGYDSSCEVDIATIPSFSIPNLSFSNVNKDSLTI